MKKSNIMLTGAAALVALTAVVGMSISAFAQGNPPDGAFQRGMNLTDEQRTQIHEAMKTKMEELGIDTSEMQNRWEDREAKRAERQANHEAVEAAIDANDYEAFAAAIGDNSPFSGKINKDNFERFVKAHNLMEEGRQIMEDLGVERGMGRHGGGRWGR